MRQILLILMLSLLLCGCASSSQEAPIKSIPPEISETTIPATVPTLPPDPLQEMLEAMSLEEKVGQMFLARCPGETALADLKTYHLGGYLLFGQDFTGETPDSLTQKLEDYQNASPIPLLIAVDEEGGSVCRVSSNPAFRDSLFPSPRSCYAAGGMEQVLAVEGEKAVFLRELGIQVNMAPVCDIATIPGAFLYQRSLGQGPQETGRFVAGTVAVMGQHRVGSVLKHFPGYGNNADTHTGIARDDRTLAELESWDLIPFAAGIQAGCDAILVSHILVSALDETTPASLSPTVHDYLRNTMGFDGVILTDDLVMGAIADAYGVEEAAVLAVLAGNDMLCSTDYAVQYSAVLEAAENGQISEDLLNDAVLRILNWKQDLGLLP